MILYEIEYGVMDSLLMKKGRGWDLTLAVSINVGKKKKEKFSLFVI